MHPSNLYLALCALATAVAAQQPVWSQCGGIGWTADAACVAGTTCTILNAYYSQCIPSSNVPTSSSVPSTSAPSQPTGVSPPSEANFWFSFGDSYTQTGFTTTGTQPTVGNPLGNPPYPGDTAVGGTNWIDVDTTKYNKSLVLTFNYAYGGATIDAGLVAPTRPTILTLTDQVNQFLSGAANKPSYAPWTSSNSLVSIWIGINDIGHSYSQPGNRSEFSDDLLDAYFALVQKIERTEIHVTSSNVGGRNFLFINVPPVDRSPMMLSQAASAQALEKSVIADFNSKLTSRVGALKANITDVQTWLWDSNAAFTTVLNSPTTYGFVDATSFGGSGDFWGNNYHPSSAAHEILGQNVAAVLADTIW